MKTASPGTPRVRDAASVLPVLGAFLLMPPVITLFTGARTVWGVPLIIVYLFGVWLALIVAAALLARQLAPPPVSGPPASAPPPSLLPAAPASAQPDDSATR